MNFKTLGETSNKDSTLQTCETISGFKNAQFTLSKV